MSVVFVDTSALYAVLDRDDSNHARAAAIWPGLLRESTLVTHNYVLVETAALIQHRLGLGAARALATEIVPLLSVGWIDQHRHAAAQHAVLAAARKRLSLVDCASFLVMRECGIEQAFCFDAHFKEQGFEVLP
ncbi:MAG TPA: PIN domain-containing protein [Bryobacteraceae bacterium]|nr:PIN domain-containing protein [Bryobacteraceae bacterium]HPT27362.1 PIN domain-containing protein [Bryobacteraceae bacterium]